MEIKSVFDDEFRHYGAVHSGFNLARLLSEADKTEMPDEGTKYLTSVPALENTDVFDSFRDSLYGGMPIQIGLCWGYNTKLNCLEYHRDSEFNVSSRPFVLLLALESEVEDWTISSQKVRAFLVPANTLVEVYSTSLHYAPCQTDNMGFKVVVVLPKGTNTDLDGVEIRNDEDRLLLKRNKWLIAHKDTKEAESGAYVGITGKNIDIENL